MGKKDLPKQKRVVVCSDYHCGHVVGLTPPDWQDKIIGGSRTQWNKFAKTQVAIWKWYAKEIDALKPIDILVVNGDAIDGKGSLSGSTEAREADRLVQIEMAEACINYVGAGKIVMTYGTAYHTGKEEDWEALIARHVGAKKIGSHEWIDINGVVMDFKHHIGSSQIPHGRHTAAARDNLQNLLWAERKKQPRASVIIRSHVHYFNYCGGADWVAMTTPALQGYGSKFGARRMSAPVDVGFIHIDVTKEGGHSWQAHIAELPCLKAHALKL